MNRPDAWIKTLKVGDRVKATTRITESGGGKGSVGAPFPSPQYIHAEPGEFGTVESVDAVEPAAAFVRFHRTRHATSVGAGEIRACAVERRGTYPVNARDIVDRNAARNALMEAALFVAETYIAVRRGRGVSVDEREMARELLVDALASLASRRA